MGKAIFKPWLKSWYLQGPKGEPGKDEMMDYDGNISEALQVSNCPPLMWSDCWVLYCFPGNAETQKQCRSASLAVAAKGSTWLFCSPLHAHCFGRSLGTLFSGCINSRRLWSDVNPPQDWPRIWDMWWIKLQSFLRSACWWCDELCQALG